MPVFQASTSFASRFRLHQRRRGAGSNLLALWLRAAGRFPTKEIAEELAHALCQAATGGNCETLFLSGPWRATTLSCE